MTGVQTCALPISGVGTFRAPGRYESCFIRERLLDMAAADLGIDPAELRFKNLIQPSQMPYNAGRTRADGDTIFDSGNYPQGLTRALDQIGYAETNPKRWVDEAGRYHGIGIATYVKNTGRGPYEGARIVISDTGDVAVYLGITTMGQGHETTMAQICADSLGVSMDAVTIYHGNTDYIPFGGGTYGSRGTVMGGNAVHLVCQNMKERILSLASTYLDTEPANLVLQTGEIFRKGIKNNNQACSTHLQPPTPTQLQSWSCRSQLQLHTHGVGCGRGPWIHSKSRGLHTSHLQPPIRP